ncbi:MAG: HEAT repeat domain-containing protein [Promethearchaeota archaeon]
MGSIIGNIDLNMLISDFLAAVIELFSIPIKWDFYTVLMIIVFILSGVGGYYLIAQQIKLVKGNAFSIGDYVKCIVYAFIFASGVFIIIAMMMIFALNGTKIKILPPQKGDFSALFLWPIAYLMIFLLVFPLVELLYMAHSKENKGLTVFEEFVADKILHKVNRFLAYILAVLLWLGIYIIPPTLIWLIGGLPFIFPFLTFSMAVPIIIINHFGDRGYIKGLVDSYYHIPVMSRSVFLSFDTSKRVSREFLDKPIPRIWYILQIVLYVWTWISLIQTVNLIFSGSLAINTMSGFTVFVVLTFGITGYFSRFWGRKVKFRTMDILIAAWLIACVGINVMINFMMANADKLAPTFLHWSVTAPIAAHHYFPSGDHLLFVPAAVIEEITIIFYITYYVLGFRIPGFKNDFYHKTKYSAIDAFANKFDPIPLFNLIRVKEQDIKEHAKTELIKMYGRLPYKKDLKLTDWRYMDPLFDAFTDYNKDSYNVAEQILTNLIKEHIELISPVISDALKSPNYVKKLNTSKLIFKLCKDSEDIEKILGYILINEFINLLDERGYDLKNVALDILLLYPQYSNTQNTDDKYGAIANINRKLILELIEDADYSIQAKTISLLNKYNIGIDTSLILRKLNHVDKNVKKAAALYISNFGKLKDKGDIKRTIESLLNVLENPEVAIKSTAINALTKIGNFKKNKIPYEPFLENISSLSKEIRLASRDALIQYLNEKHSKDKDRKVIISELLEKIEHSEEEIKIDILSIFTHIHELKVDERVQKTIKEFCLNNIKSKNEEMKNVISEILINMGKTETMPIIIEDLLKIEDEKTFFKAGIIGETIANICLNNKYGYKILEQNLNNPNEIVKFNIAKVYSILLKKGANLIINIDDIFTLLKSEGSITIKNEYLKFINDYIIRINEDDKYKKDIRIKEMLSGLISSILELLNERDNSVRLAAFKLLLPLSEIIPEKIPFDLVIKLASDKDSFIKENALKILAKIGAQNEKEVGSILVKMLNEPDWNVKIIALDMINSMKLYKKDPKIIKDIEGLAKDPQKWTRIKIAETLFNVYKENPKLININIIKGLISDEDSDVRVASAKLPGLIKNTDLALELIIKLMEDKEEKVREQASASLVELSYNTSLDELLPKTLKYFSDEIDIKLQRSVAIALKRILKYEKQEYKQRLISLLKIRVEISSDPVLMKILQELNS